MLPLKTSNTWKPAEHHAILHFQMPLGGQRYLVNKMSRKQGPASLQRGEGRLGFRRLVTHSSNEGPLNLRLLNSEHIGLVPLYINILKINMLQALQKKTETAGRRAGEKE